MNKTKRGLQLGAAITSIVLSSILAIVALYLICALKEVRDAFAGDPEFSGVMYASTMLTYVLILFGCYVLILFGCIANIVVSALICRKPINTTHKGLCITSLVLNAALALFYIIGASLWCVLPLIIVGLFIAELCLNSKVPAATANLDASNATVVNTETTETIKTEINNE